MKVESIFTVSSLVLVSICVAQPIARDIEGQGSSVDEIRRTKREPFGLGLIKLGAVGGAVGALGAAKALHHFAGYGHGKYYGGDHYYGGHGYGYYKKPYVDYGYVGYDSYPVIYKGHFGGYGGGFNEGYGYGYPPVGHGHGGYVGDYGIGGGSAASASAYASASSSGGTW